MKLIRILFILLMCATGIMSAQTIVPKKCNICGKPLAQCQYKGRHPNPVPNQSSDKQSTQPSNLVLPSNPTSGFTNGHEWVDLGLPSGTKWATMNVGASSPSDYGSYYAWGETSPKSNYTWQNLKYFISGDRFDNLKFSKYVSDSTHGTVDNKKELDPSDDAAYVNWGSGWRMPSYAQQDELLKTCKWTWTSMGGHYGYKVVGSNGNSIFLPATGYWNYSSSYNVNSCGDYWSRTLVTNFCWHAYSIYFNSSEFYRSGNRYYGRSVRPVLIAREVL